MTPHKLGNIPGRTITINNKQYHYFGGTAYLGLQSHQPFVELFLKNVSQYGFHYGASRKSNVSLGIYAEAEKHLSTWIGSEACITLSSGYLAAQLIVQTFLQQGHSLFIAPNAHHSLYSYGAIKTNTHEELKNKIENELRQSRALPPVVLFDTLDFSKKGYPDFEELKKLPLDKIILVGDDSHGIGIVGKEGKGCYGPLKKLGVSNLLVCSSLGKGLGIQAGAIFGSTKNIDVIRETSFYGSASPPLPAFMATLIDAFNIYKTRRLKMVENLTLFKKSLNKFSLFTHIDGHPTFEFQNPELVKYLESKNFIITNFSYPNKDSKITSRIVLSAHHTKSDIERLANCINTF